MPFLSSPGYRQYTIHSHKHRSHTYIQAPKTVLFLTLLKYLYKVAFWLSGNPLRFNMNAQWCLYFLRRVQCSLTWHVLQADMPAMCSTVPRFLTCSWSTVLHVPEAVHACVGLNKGYFTRRWNMLVGIFTDIFLNENFLLVSICQDGKFLSTFLLTQHEFLFIYIQAPGAKNGNFYPPKKSC